MKKEYQKPTLFAESFQMVEHIADGCDGAFDQSGNQQRYHDGRSCQYLDQNGERFFTADTTACEDVQPVFFDVVEGLFECYHGPVGGSATPFSS